MKINEYVELRESKIHHKGIFAIKDIPAHTEIIEYTGRLVNKEEGERIERESIEKSKKDKTAAGTYVFDMLDGTYLDGGIPTNYAKYINHSCEPNSECILENKKLLIFSMRDIKKGEEITFNYGFNLEENFKDHPCNCGSKICVGYILGEHEWPHLMEKFGKKK